MIAAIAILLILGLSIALSFMGHASHIPIGPVLALSGLFAFFFCSGVYIAVTLGVLGLLAGLVFSDRPFWLFVGQNAWDTSTNYVLIAVPLFLLMGEILLRSGQSQRLYRALGLWLNRLPGGLLHTNIVSCGIFATICGSSIATAATMGSVALPYFEGTKYDRRMVLGSMAAGGALGNLLPPGITLIIYGLLTETSVGKLYIGSILPALMVMGLCVGYIALDGLRHPPAGDERKVPLSLRLKALLDLLPSIALILLVLGSIYGGFATPSEAAALGVVGASIIAVASGEFSFDLVQRSARATARNTALIGMILLGAFLLSYILTSLRLPQAAAAFVTTLPLPKWAIMALIVLFYFALGTFMEGFAMIITTIPIIFPIVKLLGYDPIWFGILATLLIELTLITPPEGTILYVLQGVRPRRGPINDIFVGVMPFVGLYMLAIVILFVFPQIALWLPKVVY
jgi:tripartite ATP-independent transporter DctM subunit